MIESFSVSCENIYVTTVKMNKWKGKLKEKTPINYEIKIKSRAADGRINNVDFIPSSMTLELQNTIKNITKDDKYTRKGN